MKFVIGILLFVISFSANCQNQVFGNNQLFQITKKNQVIDFTVYKSDNEKKPLLLFCQGSLPVPLFIKFEDGFIFDVQLNNFNVKTMSENYHIVVISKPFTPAIVNSEHLNSSYCYITDTTNQYSYDIDYLKHDFTDNYIFRAKEVLNFLQKEKWVDTDNWIIAGHSQGARDAVFIASEIKKFTKIGLFGYDPKGRFEQAVREIRKDAENEIISWEKADSLLNEWLEDFKIIQHGNNERHNWRCYNQSSLPELLKLKIPIYVAYGSHDIIADVCDFLPFYFADKKKTNLTIKRYANLEHNFFPIIDEKIDYKNGRWKEVMNAFIEFSPR